MKICSELRDYVNWQERDGTPSAQVRAHVRDCPACREALQKWREIEPALRAADSLLTGDAVGTAEEARGVVRRASSRQKPASFPGFRRWGLVAAAAIVLVLAVGGYLLFHPEDKPSVAGGALFGSGTMYANGAADAFTIDRAGQRIDVPGNARALLVLGTDTIGLASGTGVEIEKVTESDTRVVLEEGVVSCAVSRRKKGQGFAVISKGVEVRVTGTRFSVERRDALMSVAVVEGSVGVETADGRAHSVVAGEQLDVDSRGALKPAPISEKSSRLVAWLLHEPRGETVETADSPPPPSKESGVESDDETTDTATSPSGEAPAERNRKRSINVGKGENSSAGLSTWRRWIVEGRIEDARQWIESHLRDHPKDGAAWSLLADCRRKRGEWEQAVDAYFQVMRFATAADAGRARFRAGAILQDRLSEHRRAAELFEAYVAGADGSMKAEGMVRLARSYRALGREREARQIIEAVTREHRGTTAASQAQKMLSSGDNTYN
jgi:ferric-dicitrate binding protein FerR (iron transport regulator)/TolA-binding protein